MSEGLVGKNITVYILGGVRMCGEVISQDKESIFLEIDSEVYMVFKSKVCYVKLGIEKNEENIESSKKDDYSEDVNEVFPQNGMTYSEAYGSLPIGLLDVDEEEDFSVFFGGSSSDKISFSVEGENDEKARENDTGREK